MKANRMKFLLQFLIIIVIFSVNIENFTFNYETDSDNTDITNGRLDITNIDGNTAINIVQAIILQDNYTLHYSLSNRSAWA